MAASAQGVSQQAYLLQATDRLIDQHEIEKAQSILKTTREQLPPNLRAKKQLITAKLLVAYHQNDEALSTLQAMTEDHSAWTRADQIEWHQIAALANKNLGNFNASIQQRSDMIPLLSSREEKKQQLLTIWQSLEKISAARINRLLSQANTAIVKGWLSLVALTDRPNISPEELTQLLQHWKSEYRHHPAAALLPASFKQSDSRSITHPKRIALLLPLKGQYGNAGNAIKNGFLAAYYHKNSHHQATSNIMIIDTNDRNIPAAYQEAIRRGANVVIGPLVKSNITALAQSTTLTVPTIVLNTVSHLKNRRINNLYQFGLSPEDEAQQIAMKAWDEHLHSAILFAPKNAWGQSIAAAFEKTWQSLGGQTVAYLAYTDQQNLSKEVRHLLNIDQARQRAKQLKRLLHKKIRYIPRRRKDADMIFIVASASMARQLRPMLRYYYAGNMPTYAISNIYAGQPNAHRDHDLNGIRFPDMPWVLTDRLKPNSLNTIRQSIQQTWPKSYAKQPKLFALGVDAYNIITQINKMLLLPELGTPAATGVLYLNHHNIYRKLSWSKIVNGTPHHLK
jgi:uncharacterized protein